MKYFIITTMLLSSIFAYSDESFSGNKYLLLIGGGGEPSGSTTRFDAPLMSTGLKLMKAGWKTDVLFNGGHSVSEQLSEQTFGKKNKSFTESNLNEYLEKIKDLILKKQLKKGDEFLLIIQTHGKEPVKNKKYHDVYLANDSFISTGKFKDLADLLKENHIKMGVIDMSCFGGASLQISNPNTCVMSLSSPTTTALFDQYNYYINEIKAGVSLEQVFLNGRMKDPNPKFPEISTQKGMDLTELFKEFETNLDKITESKTDACARKKQFDSTVIKLINDISKITDKLNVSKADVDALRKLIIEYKELILSSSAINQRISNSSIRLKEESFNNIRIGEMTSSTTFSLGYLATVDVDSRRKNLSAQLALKIKNGDTNKYLMEVEFYALPEIEKRKRYLEQTYPDFKKLENDYAQLQSIQKLLDEVQDKIIRKERAIYQNNYIKENGRNKKQCNGFIL